MSTRIANTMNTAVQGLGHEKRGSDSVAFFLNTHRMYAVYKAAQARNKCSGKTVIDMLTKLQYV